MSDRLTKDKIIRQELNLSILYYYRTKDILAAKNLLKEKLCYQVTSQEKGLIKGLCTDDIVSVIKLIDEVFDIE